MSLTSSRCFPISALATLLSAAHGVANTGDVLRLRAFAPAVPSASNALLPRWLHSQLPLSGFRSNSAFLVSPHLEIASETVRHYPCHDTPRSLVSALTF